MIGYKSILLGVAFALIFEGSLPSIVPSVYKEYAQAIAKLPDMTLRVIGLAFISCGVLLIYVVHVF